MINLQYVTGTFGINNWRAKGHTFCSCYVWKQYRVSTSPSNYAGDDNTTSYKNKWYKSIPMASVSAQIYSKFVFIETVSNSNK